jgi:curli biogenesis system outer membrane secretion channel CsgG
MDRRRLIGLAAVVLLRVTVATGALAQEASARPSIAIADVGIAAGGWTLPPPQISASIVELMMNELVSSQRFRAYDGQWLVPEVEIGRANLERLRAAAAERHMDYIVVGSVTSFSNEQRKKRGLGILPTPFFLGGFAKQQQLLKVSLTFRIVDVRTGEVVSSVHGEGIGTRRSTSGGAAGFVKTLPLGGLHVSSAPPSARDAMLDEAVRQAVRNAAIALAQAPLPTARQ